MTNGCSADACDEVNFEFGEKTTLETLRRYTKAIVELFHQRYLRSPTEADLRITFDEMLPEDFLVCSGRSTAPTGFGKTVLSAGRDITRTEKGNDQL